MRPSGEAPGRRQCTASSARLYLEPEGFPAMIIIIRRQPGKVIYLTPRAKKVRAVLLCGAGEETMG
jgi:hypothetical protein